jgi:hypothetical protein
MGHDINAYKGLVGKDEGTVPLGRPGGRWENNVQINLKIGRKWIEIFWLIICQSGGLLSGRSSTLNHHKCGKLHDCLWEYEGSPPGGSLVSRSVCNLE